MKKVIVISMVFVILACLILLTGCQEGQKQEKVWGQGQPPTTWTDYFGNGNNARLDFMQNRAIEGTQAVIYGANTKDVQGNVIHKQGIFERIDEMNDRLDKLEERVYGGTSDQSEGG